MSWSEQLLALPILALRDRVFQELIDNPVLEKVDPSSDPEYSEDENHSIASDVSVAVVAADAPGGLKVWLPIEPEQSLESAKTEDHDCINLFSVPDAVIALDENGNWGFRLILEHVPFLVVSGHYKQLAHGRDTNQETRTYVLAKIASAHEFIEAIEFRHAVLKDIMSTILAVSPTNLPPANERIPTLTLNHLAQTLAMPVRTVRAALENKIVGTPNGMIPLWAFVNAEIDEK